MSRSEAQCFETLGLSGHEDLDTIRKTYRRIARRLHPDRRGGDETEFLEITAAYNTLIETLAGRPRPGRNAERRENRPHRERGTARRQAQSHRSTGNVWQSWTPGQEGSFETGHTERPDWSSFEKVYRERQARRKARQRAAREATIGRSETETTRSRVENGARVEPRRDAEGRNRTSRREEPNRKTTPTTDDDLATAWHAWCEGARRYQSASDWRDPSTSGTADESGQTDPTPQEEAISDQEPSFWRRLFSRKPQSNTRRPSVYPQGVDLVLRLPVNVKTLVHGGQTRIAIRRDAACPICDGQATPDCRCCEGRGRIRVREELTVDVPPGARVGDQLVVEGKGSDGLQGMKNGDLLLNLIPAALPGFRRRGNDLHGVCTLSPALARTGGHLVVDLPRGRVKLNVPPRTCVGDRFRLKGQGLVAWKGNTTGDAYLTVEVR